MNPVTVTLLYADGRTWMAGGFGSEEEALAWWAQAQKQSDFDPTTQIKIHRAETATTVESDVIVAAENAPPPPSILTRISNFFGFGQ